MKKIMLTVLGVALITTSSSAMATAAEHHQMRKIYRTNEPFRNSNNFVTLPAQPDWQSYVDGHAISAPAGR